MSKPPLWHNMSAPPKTAISFEPDDALRTFRCLLVEAPGPLQNDTSKSLLEKLDGKPWAGTEKSAASELRRRLNRHARALRLPPLVLLGDPKAYPPDERWDDLLTVLTIFSKSGNTVYLRDKEPHASAIRRNRPVMLLVPRATPRRRQEVRCES
jgi:hypothetical protein